MGARIRKLENTVLVTLVLVGVLVNFLPTINYYLAVHPRLKDNVLSKDVFLEYHVDVSFALVGVPEASGNNTTIVFAVKPGTLVLRPINKTLLEYRFTGDVRISFPLNGTMLHKEIRSRGFVSRDSALGKLIVLPTSGNGAAVKLSNTTVWLKRVPPNIISFGVMLNPRFYLKPIAYHGKVLGGANTTQFHTVYLTYWELEKGGLLLATYAYSKDYPPVDGTVVQLLDMMFSGEPRLRNLVGENTGRISGVRLVMDISNANVRLKNDLLGRLLFDFTVTYFPVNIALIAVGFVGLILLHRRRI